VSTSVSLKTLLLLGAAGAAFYFYKRSREQRTRLDQQPVDLDTQPASTTAMLTQRAKDALATLRSTGSRSGATATFPGTDAALSRRVEDTLSLNPNFSPGRVYVSAQKGRITLRGTADVGDHIRAFEQTASGVPGVAEVVNLLHIEGTPAPTQHRGGLASESVDQAFVPVEP